MEYLDKLGWPIERIKGRRIFNFLRLLIHTRKIMRKWAPPKQTGALLGIAMKRTPEGGNDGE